MAEVKWTDDQQKVISLRDRNLLVSAAAGSGKTAVLVERIIRKITDPVNPTDIDRLLVMTFTRAAAAEMKERIIEALEKTVYEHPEDTRLQKQISLIHTAQITTIDGFCSYLLKNYFHLISLDAGYRIGDEGEMKLLRGEVMKTFLEKEYKKGTAEFRNFMNAAATGKSDEAAGELILKVYDQAMSNPDPGEWLAHCADLYRKAEEGKETPFFRLLWDDVRSKIRDAMELTQEAEEICSDPGNGLLPMLPALEEDQALLVSLLGKAKEQDFDGMADDLRSLKFKAFGRIRTGTADEQKKEEAKELRTTVKKILKKIGEDYFALSAEQLSELSGTAAEQIRVLADLTRGFGKAFREEKRKRNVLDFNDVEHLALEILEDRQHGMTDAARELSGKYDEVMIDEYQDSNLLQERIMNCVSGWAEERKNIFMVGDVKQSIYRFRLARPELFMEKYRRYSDQDGEEQKIDLHRNFRSRKEVLSGVNYLFRAIMGEDLGGVGYDDAAALYYGADYPDPPEGSDVRTEILIAGKEKTDHVDENQETEGVSSSGEGALEEDEEERDERETEAMMIAQRIRELMKTQKIYDRKAKEYRDIRYGDIAILLRTFAGWGETFSEVLSDQGIPVYTVSRTGYFSASEVKALLNYLQICSNPRQDIPLAGVLRSPFAELSAAEMADIRAEFPDGLLLDSVRAFSEKYGEADADTEKGRLGKRIRNFLHMLDAFRDRSRSLPVHQLIAEILEKTGYGNAAAALPGGEQRKANLTMLITRAREYEKTSYKGLFNFIRYIEQLKSYEVDFGEANLSGAGEGAVSIMTIHKSKGLEFPVVFAAGMGKRFNLMDVNAAVVSHPELGIGMDAVFPGIRFKTPTIQKQLIRNVLHAEEMGEILRILYVAFTRAKEKLIITGTMADPEKELLKAARQAHRQEMLLPCRIRKSALKGWDLILPALSGHRSMQQFLTERNLSSGASPALDAAETEFVITLTSIRQMAEKAAEQEFEKNIMDGEILRTWDETEIFDEGIREELEKQFQYRYPHEQLSMIPEKVSVSELKKRSCADEAELEENIFQEPDVIPLIPEFIEKKKTEVRGAERGTAYHTVMEHLDYARTGEEELNDQIRELKEKRYLTKEQADCIRVGDLVAFLGSDLGKRMRRAALDGRLYREQPFMIQRKAPELDPSWKEETGVLIQGIIDAYFQEEDEIVLVDYKTDFVHRGEEQKLAALYHVQLEDYACALCRLTEKNVKEKYIYSFTLGKEIRL